MISQTALSRMQSPGQGQQKSLEPPKWEPMPSEKVYSIEILGEPDVGKTHFLATFPNMAMADTEGKANIVMEKFGNTRWSRIKNFNDIRRFIEHCIVNPEIKTVAIDSGSDLVDFAEAEWLAEHPKRSSVYVPGQGAFQYADVYDKIDSLVNKVVPSGKYLVISGRLKDEFAPNATGESTRTGQRIRDSYKKFPYSLAIQVRLVEGITVKETVKPKTYFPDIIFGKVIKNNFLAKRVQKPYLLDVSFNGIKNELMSPYCESFDEKCSLVNCKVCPKGKLKDIVKEAKDWLKSTGQLSEDEDDAEPGKQKRA